jgi:hypothetical protein
VKSLRILSLFAVLCLSFGTTSFASTRSSGWDPQLTHQITPPSIIHVQPCTVLWFGEDIGDEIPRLTGLGLSITHTFNPADLSAANLANYNVLVIAHTGPGVIGGSQAAIEAFVSANHGLLIEQPNTVGVLDYAPTGFGVNIVDDCWCGGHADPTSCLTLDYNGTIVNGAHPITSGLVDGDLSGDFDSAANLGGSYSVLAHNTVCTNNPSLAAGTLGTGRVVFETGLASNFAFVTGSDAYWARLFEWLCVGSQTPTADPTWGRLKVLYR